MTNSSWKTKGLIWAPIIARYALWNLMIYMTDKWDSSSAMAAAIVNSFWGITDMLQIVMKFFLDAFVGNFRMALFFGSAYSIGLCLLSASVKMNEKNLYFLIALVVLSLGISSGKSISLDELTQQGDNDLAIKEDRDLARGGDSELAIEEDIDLAREGDSELLAIEEDRDLARGGNSEEDRDLARGGDSELAIEEDIDLAREGDSELLAIEEARDIARGGDSELAIEEGDLAREGDSGLAIEEGIDLAREGDSELATEEDTKYLARFRSYASKFFHQHKNKFILALIHVVGVVILTFTDYEILFFISALCMVAATLVFASYNPGQARGSHQTTAYSRFKNCLKGRSSLANNGNGEEQQRNGRSERGRPAAMRKRRFLVCMAFFMLGVVSAVGDTYFLDQADTMNNKHAPPTFMLQLWYYFAQFIFSTTYTEIVKRINSTDLKKYAGCAGLSVSMVLAIFCCFTAARVETERLNRVKSDRVVLRHNEYSEEYNMTDMTTFWMVPQYTLLGGLEGISSKSIDLLFSNYPLEPMDPYLNHLATGVHGFGKIGNILAVFILGKASAWRDGTSWFQDTLDKSRLDKYYWSLAAVSIVNLVFYTILYYWHDLCNHVSELRLSIVSSNTQGREAADHVP